MARIDPTPTHRFNVEIDGVVVAHFRGLTGLSSEHEVITHVEGGRNDAGIKLPGQRQYGELTLQRGYAIGTEMLDWIRQVGALGSQTRAVRKTMSVIVLAEDVRSEMGRYDLVGVWPRKWSVADLSAEGSEIAIESLELAHEGLTFRKGGGPAGAAGRDVAQRAAAAARAARAAARSTAGGAAGVGGAGGAAGAVGAAARGAMDAVAGAVDRAEAAAQSVLDAGWAAVEAGAGAGGDAAAAVERALGEGAAAAVADLPGPAGAAAGAAVSAALGGDAGGASGVAGAAAGGAGVAPVGGGGFARAAGGPDAGGAAGGRWSDQVAPRQAAGGFGEPGLPPGR